MNGRNTSVSLSSYRRLMRSTKDEVYVKKRTVVKAKSPVQEYLCLRRFRWTELKPAKIGIHALSSEKFVVCAGFENGAIL